MGGLSLDMLLELGWGLGASQLGATFVGYPLALALRARVAPRPVRPRIGLPRSVSVILAARDEERHIAQKIEAFLAHAHAVPELEIIVVSDGSRDRTVARAWSVDDVRVRVLERPHRGKAAALADAFAIARGEVLVLSDVRQQLGEDVLSELLAPFADPEVGVVSAELDMGTERGPGLYWRYERAIRRAESRTGSVPGATGALYAIRRGLAVAPEPGALLDDVLVPVRAALRGARIVLAERARVRDVEAEPEHELARKARTIAGTYQLCALEPRLLSPRSPLFARFVMHKLARLISPLAMALVLACDVALVWRGSAPHTLTLALSLAFWGAAIAAALGAPLGALGRAARAFALLQWAAVLGALRYARGDLRWTGARTRALSEVSR